MSLKAAWKGWKVGKVEGECNRGLFFAFFLLIVSFRSGDTALAGSCCILKGWKLVLMLAHDGYLCGGTFLRMLLLFHLGVLEVGLYSIIALGVQLGALLPSNLSAIIFQLTVATGNCHCVHTLTILPTIRT